MGESVSVRCPECRRSHAYAAPAFPCPCGHPVAPQLIPGATVERIRHRTWLDAWVTVRCRACGREDQWPHPELGCGCGAVLRVPVAAAGEGEREEGYGSEGRGAEEGYGSEPRRPEEGYGPEPRRPAPYAQDATAPDTAAPDASITGPASDASDPGTGLAPEPEPDREPAPSPSPVSDGSDGSAPVLPRAARDDGAGAGGAGRRRPAAPVSDWFGNPPRSFAERHPDHTPLPATAPRPAGERGAFRPVTIRTARDAVAAAATYLHWLGFRDLVQPEDRHSAGVDLRGAGLVAQVDPSTRPAGLRAVECLWLNGLSASAVSVFFSLAGYTPEARSRAAEIGLPLFVLDLTGTPQPVNDAADALTSGGAI